MSVEAHHLNLFLPQLIPNKEVMNLINNNTAISSNPLEATNMMYTQIGYGGIPQINSSLPKIEPNNNQPSSSSFLPLYNSHIVPVSNHNHNNKLASWKDDSGLTSYYTLPRKRLRDDYSNNSINQQPISIPSSSNMDKGYRSNFVNGSSFSFMGEDFSSQIIQQQMDIDHFISQHMDKVRMEMEERRKRNCRRVVEVVEEGILKRLRAKEEEIEKIGKLNWALEERVKSLAVENQIWRDLAQTNEATANALRTNLEHVQAQVKDVRGSGARLDGDGAGAAVNNDQDAESCCGSSGGNSNEEADVEEVSGWRTLAIGRSAAEAAKDMNNEVGVKGRCKNCGKEEACVLLLPCRHLCLCSVCGSSVHTCPVCKSYKNASVHVNPS